MSENAGAKNATLIFLFQTSPQRTMRCLLCHRLAQSQLTAVADGIQALSQLKTVAKWLPATRSAARQFSAKGDADAPPQRLVTALLKVIAGKSTGNCTASRENALALAS